MVVSEGFSSSLRMFYKYFRMIFVENVGEDNVYLQFLSFVSVVSHSHPGTTRSLGSSNCLHPGIQVPKHPVSQSSSPPVTQAGWPTSHPHPGVMNTHTCPDKESVMNRIICLHNFHRVPHIQIRHRLFSKGVLCYIFGSSAKFLGSHCS